MIFTMASSVDKINRNVNNPQFNTITIMIYGKVQRLIGVHVIWNYNAIMRVPNSAALRGRLGLLWYKHQGSLASRDVSWDPNQPQIAMSTEINGSSES